ncbi:DNA polymerase III subunit gamma/tau [Enemella dayhoffiae]|uniref:DNA polymerase III subunit gamma/tau n=1 Tax=Enemella dayhoffiae TaxID=2016507 RepID=A0A255HC42_9ACTN|nr:DNA polymerase III subunit gamma/tau [Enemella dayhoffiae]
MSEPRTRVLGVAEEDEFTDDYGFEPFEQEGEALFGGDEPAEPAPAQAAPPAPPAPSRPERTPAPSAPLALYRRYRPDTFADVIGQEHVTDPLQRALVNNRVNHAYLFSGPRGCGKTTSARILARCLNCEQGPTPTPCGKCQSCTDLARGGPGSIDVIEIDAASHGGVDDARDLRERAFFAPVHSRYKIYIVDEAHMVTTAGFNALLKLVEEPPPHVKFIFATTEPERVIGTIRSRTHHYPFRLVPPKVLQAYLARLCEAEGIAVEQTVLPLVVRAGQGSVRDSLSVLDQLLGGAAESGVSYAQATALLGYTPDSLLDEVLDAFAAGDAAGVFACVDKVIEVGQDPRRFGEDLLRRLRDLVIVAAVPDALGSGLVEAAEDQGERLQSQAAALGAGELTRAAEVIAAGLTEMRGTTAPRLHLELMCARVLLPGADVDDRGIHARLDRLERRIGVQVPGDQIAPEPAAAQTPPRTQEPQTAAPAPVPPPAPEQAPEPVRSAPADRAPTAPRADPRADPPAAQPAPQPTGLSTADVRRLWPEVLEEVKTRRRFTWILVSQNAQVHEVRDGALVLALKNAGARDSFGKSGHQDVVTDALVQVLGANLRIETLVDGGASAEEPARDPWSGRTPERPAPARPAQPVRDPEPDPEPAAATAEPPPQQRRQPTDAQSPEGANGRTEAPAPSPELTQLSAKAREGIRPTRHAGSAPPDDEPEPDPYDDYDPDSAPEVSEGSHGELLSRHLGAQLIGEEESGA